jgi:hypothetical protein
MGTMARRTIRNPSFSLLVGTEDSKQTCTQKDVARTTQPDIRTFMVESWIQDMDKSIDHLGSTQCLHVQKQRYVKSETKPLSNIANVWDSRRPLTNATPRTFWLGVVHPNIMDKRGVVQYAIPSPAIIARPFPVVWPVTTTFPAILTAGIAMAHADAPIIIVTRSLELDIVGGYLFSLWVGYIYLQ